MFTMMLMIQHEVIRSNLLCYGMIWQVFGDSSGAGDRPSSRRGGRSPQIPGAALCVSLDHMFVVVSCE